MTTTEQSNRNGVDTGALFATINVVKAQRALAKFQFRAHSEWVSGAHSHVEAGTFDGAGGTHEHKAPHASEVDHPAVLVGTDEGPTPVEYLLVGLGRLPDGRDRQRRSGTRRHVAFGHRERRRRHRPPGHPRPLRRRAERLRADPYRFHDRRGRARGQGCRDRRAIARPVGGLRRAHQRRARHDRRHVRLTIPCGAAGAPPGRPRLRETFRAAHRHDHRGRRPSRPRGQQPPHARVVTTCCWSAAASVSGGGPNVGSPCGCSRRTG